MVAGYHLIWTLYGWWLPNDPRGSNSRDIRVALIQPLGDIHPGRKKVQPRSSEIRAFYEKAEDLLKHPLLAFSQEDLPILAEAFRKVILDRQYVCYACALMPDHVHMLIRRHRDYAEQMIELFQSGSRQAVIEAKIRSVTHPVWGGPGWKVFLNSREDFTRTIEYIRQNPIKIGWPEQKWDFVQEYDGWLP